MLRRRPAGCLGPALVLSAASFSTSSKPLVRLHLTQPLCGDATIVLPDEQRHYLRTVLRLQQGATLGVFNGQDGEWMARVRFLDRKHAEIQIQALLRPQPDAAEGPLLAFAVLKNARLPFVVEKATELGAATLQPVLTQYCATRNINLPRLEAVAAGAAEQSRRLTVPTIAEPLTLSELLRGWDETRPLCVCDERGGAPPLSPVLFDRSPGVLIGPEGGFSADEFELVSSCEFVRLVSLGPSTLRAETAGLAALAVLGCE